MKYPNQAICPTQTRMNLVDAQTPVTGEINYIAFDMGDHNGMQIYGKFIIIEK